MNAQQKDSEITRASLELLYHVSRELSSALDLRTVLQRVLFLSMRTIGATSGSVMVLDDSGKPIESAILVGDQVHNHTTQRLRATLDRGLAGWVIRNHEAVLVTDTDRDERWMRREYEDEEYAGPKSAVCAPLMARDAMVGVMTLVHPTPGFFSNDHLALVQAIADQAGIAVLNARLYAESQRKARVMTALAESAETITASLNLDDVLDRIIEQIGLALGVEAVSLVLIDPEDNMLVFQAATGGVKHQVLNTRLKLGEGIVGWVAQQGQGVVIPYVHEDERFNPDIDRLTGFTTKAIACAPLIYRDQVIGVVEALNPREGVFDPDALLVLTGIGSLAGTAIHHAQLFERLQAAHQSYRDLFEDSIDPILITDWQGKILQANRNAVIMTDFSKEDLHQRMIDQIHVVDEEQLGKSYEKLSSEDTIYYESHLRTRSGHEIPVEVYVRRVKIENTAYIQWILRDITERKNLDTMRDDLISMIYHDLRSPLANVVSSLDVLDTILHDETDISASERSLLEIAMRSTHRIQRLTESLLDMSRLEAGQPIGNRQLVQPFNLGREAVELILPIAENKHQDVVVSIPPDLPQVYIDPDMIRRVLTNLLENATKYTPAAGRIQVGASQEGEWIQIWVQDNGPGIPASEHERIFDKFSRLDAGVDSRGLGLGLAYCRLAVQGHGGRIWVESEPGIGSRFIFTLPITGQGE